ncbi:MAG TPA: VOC family protein [Actinomycetota bacterium]|jgi:catechol 2,3-dioxygenase-like lactoylglutathione lyase family enzyme|nr:VOC family protein [Actinomycetota bacterium]
MVIDLDHVALALQDVGPTLRTLVTDFGTPVLFGGVNFGFRAVQVDGGDLHIELLEPFNTEANDFLERFLIRSGEGPHHLTFKTDDIRRELERASDAGYTPVGVNIDNPWWKEAFIHPKEAGGTVVQIAQSGIEPEHLERVAGEYGPGSWWPEQPEPSTNRSVLRRVVVATEEIGRALALYTDWLGGETSGHGEGWIELAWPGGGKVMLELAAGRPEGVHRLEWTHEGERAERIVGGARMVLYSES